MDFIHEYGTQIGGLAILIIYCAEKVLTHLKNRGIDLQAMSHQVNSLHEAGVAQKVLDMHETIEKTNDKGHKLVYPETSGLETAIIKLADSISEQAKVTLQVQQGNMLIVQTLEQLNSQNSVMMDRQVQILQAIGS